MVDSLVVSTRNRDKLAELRELLGGLPYELVTAEACGVPEVAETGATLRENAALKARAAFEHTGLACLADDTGLCVDALGGAPGVHSARFSGPEATYESNRRFLLERLFSVADEDRAATFVSTLAIILPSKADPREGEVVVRGAGGVRGVLAWVEGKAEGRILRSPRGAGTFGYDPIFFYPPLDKTFAEMSRDEKNSISHRGRAYQALRAYLAARNP